MINQPGRIEKLWGYEEILHSTENFCVKYLHFSNASDQFSFHYHKTKAEEWTVVKGSFTLTTAQLTKNITEETLIKNYYNNNVTRQILKTNDVISIPVKLVHQLTALEPNSIILEVSIADHIEDNHRLVKSYVFHTRKTDKEHRCQSITNPS
jgi:mannose-6-phosphate isomerase-like protein (cupin superfamily)